MTMIIDVYDTYVKTAEGALLHFDVLLPTGQGRALQYAKEWLESIDVSPDKVTQENCRYCHREEASPKIQKEIEEQGYFILQMEGCPVPYSKNSK